MVQTSKIEQILDEASKYLKLELGLESPKASIHLCSGQEWENIGNIRGAAFYQPSEDKIYLSPSSTTADLIHEYFGHALYTEQSTLGKRLKRYLTLTSKTEEKYGIPRNANLNIKHSNEFKIENSGKDEYTIFCNINDPKIKEYTRLKKETKDFFDKTEPLQEGFSLWMEEKILKQAGLTGLWKERYELLVKSHYTKFYNAFLKEESEKGTLSLLCHLGFPKPKNKEIIKRFAKEKLKNFDSLKYLIQYGSLERDVDLIAVYPSSMLKKCGLICDGHIDANILDEKSFLKKLELYDIEITEPVVTGSLIIGDETAFKEIKSKIREGKPSGKAVDYAQRRSLETFNSALWFYNRNRFKCNETLLNTYAPEKASAIILKEETLDFCSEDLLYTLNNLSFSMSYKLSADHYKNEKSSITLKDLMKNPLLKDLMAYLKNVENSREELKEEKALGFIMQTRNFLLSDFTP